MIPTKKSVAPLVLGILSIILGLLSPIVGIVLGIIGLVLAINGGKTTEHNFKRETILNSVGIAISVINWILGMLLLMHR